MNTAPWKSFPVPFLRPSPNALNARTLLAYKNILYSSSNGRGVLLLSVAFLSGLLGHTSNLSIPQQGLANL